MDDIKGIYLRCLRDTIIGNCSIREICDPSLKLIREVFHVKASLKDVNDMMKYVIHMNELCIAAMDENRPVVKAQSSIGSK